MATHENGLFDAGGHDLTLIVIIDRRVGLSLTLIETVDRRDGLPLSRGERVWS